MIKTKSFNGADVYYPQSMEELEHCSSNMKKWGVVESGCKDDLAGFKYYYPYDFERKLLAVQEAERGLRASKWFGPLDKWDRPIDACYQNYDGDFTSPFKWDDSYDYGSNAHDEYKEQNGFRRIVPFRTQEDVERAKAKLEEYCNSSKPIRY